MKRKSFMDEDAPGPHVPVSIGAVSQAFATEFRKQVVSVV